MPKILTGKTCSLPGCTSKHTAKGYCSTHYSYYNYLLAIPDDKFKNWHNKSIAGVKK